MTIFAYYTSPTTPGAAGWSVELSGAIRLASITGLVAEAEAGAVGAGNIVLDDPTSSVGHSGDGIVGLKQFHMIETDCPIGQQRLYTGYTGDRRYYRGKSNSLITGAARVIDATLYDINSFLSFRVFAPVTLDPTSSFVRPAETDLARIAAMLTSVDFLSDTLFDIGYIPTTGGILMDKNDYTGSHPGDVLNSCAQASGRNYFVLFDETTGKYVLWYDDWKTDGTSTIVYDSPLSLTNVLSEASANAAILLTATPGDTEVTLAWYVGLGGTTFVIEPDAVETIDPSRVVSAAYLPYTGGTAYQTLPATANKFAWRDMVAPSVTVKTLAKANALATRYLADNQTEDNRIALTVQLPSSAVTLLREGMRVQLHATHLPNVSAGFTWCRVLQRTIRQDQATPSYYWVDLELSVPPLVGPTQGAFADVRRGVAPYNASPTLPHTTTPGHLLVLVIQTVTSTVGPPTLVNVGGGSPPSWSVGSAWSEAVDPSQFAGPGATVGFGIWWRRVGSGEISATPVQVNPAGALETLGARLWEFDTPTDPGAGVAYTTGSGSGSGIATGGTVTIGTALSGFILGGMAIQQPDYASRAIVVPVAGTEVSNTDGINSPNIFSLNIFCAPTWIATSATGGPLMATITSGLGLVTPMGVAGGMLELPGVTAVPTIPYPANQVG